MTDPTDRAEPMHARRWCDYSGCLTSECEHCQAALRAAEVEAAQRPAAPVTPFESFKAGAALLGLNVEQEYAGGLFKDRRVQAAWNTLVDPSWRPAPAQAGGTLYIRTEERNYMDIPAQPSDGVPSGDAPSREEEARGQICLPNGVMFDAFCQPRTRYVRVTFDGSCLVCKPEEVAQNVGDDDPSAFVLADVYLSEREFEELPEFQGW